MATSYEQVNFPPHPLSLRICSKLHDMFLGTSGRCLAQWIITSSHYVEVGILKALGFSGGTTATESKVLPGRQIKLRDYRLAGQLCTAPPPSAHPPSAPPPADPPPFAPPATVVKLIIDL